MYRLQEGGRHTIAFIFATIMPLPFIARDAKVLVWKTVLPSAIGTVVLVVTFLLLGKLPYEFDIPYATADRVEKIGTLSAELDANIEVTLGPPSYENTIIWPIWDEVEGETVVFDWGMLYAVPAGMGINACDGGYVAAQTKNLKCGYIATIKGSDVEKSISNSKNLSCNKQVAVYKLEK